MTERSLFDCTATRPVAISMAIIAAMVFGTVGLWKLPVDLLPDVSYPTLTVRTEYPGATPQDVEERVSDRVQEAVAVVPGVRRTISISRPGISDVLLQFHWGKRMEFAASDVRERLDRVFLPREARAPLVLRYDPSLDPVLTLGLSGDKSLVELRRIAEELIELELGEIPGVAAVKLRGGDEEEIRIAIDEQALAAHGLDVQLVAQRLQIENLNAESGKLEEGKTEYLVRALNEFQSLRDIEETILERRGGFSIRVKDVARVRRVPQDKQVVSRVDGRPCVLIDVYREAGKNIVDLCARVRTRTFGTPAQQRYVEAGRHLRQPAAATDDAGDPPGQDRQKAERDAQFRAAAERRQMTDFLQFEARQAGAGLDLLQDQSTFIQASIADVKSDAVVGGLLAIFVLFLFLRRFATTLILAALIPVSLLITFAPMYIAGVSLNVMSLGGLALGVGNLTDNAIVILESITRLREGGMPRVRAAVLGTARVAGAVTASTLTTVAVFLPIVFVEGVSGQLFRDQALAVVFSQVISLVVALFGVPMLIAAGGGRRGVLAPAPPASRAGRAVQALASWPLRAVLALAVAAGAVLQALLRPAVAVFDFVWRRVERGYPGLLAGALRQRLVTLGAVGALVAFTASRVDDLGNEAMPDVHQGEFYVDAFLPRDSAVERTDAVLAPLERKIAALPGVRKTFVAVGVERDELNDSDQGEHSARILVRLEPDPDRARQEQRLREQIRALLDAEPQVLTYRFARPSLLSFGSALSVEVLGFELTALRQAALAVENALRAVPGLRDVRSTLQRGNTEVSVSFDRERTMALNLDTAALTRILQTKVQGDVPTRFSERDRKIDIRVRIDPSELDSYHRLLQLNVNPAGQPPIPLESVASLQRVEGPSEIRRIGSLRGAEVQATHAGLDRGRTERLVEEALAGTLLPRGVEVRIGGDREETERSEASLRLALLLALFLVYVVLSSQFESLLQPLIIMVSVPLALVGVVPVLELLAIPISVIVLLGAIVLAGIVVNNAIILIDQINQLRAQGLAKRAAILEGARSRLRPVVMTMLSTVLGLLPLTGWLSRLPLVGGDAEGLELRAPLAITVLTGLLISTLLTLVVVPVLYSLTDRRA
jgi:HAE1 family hydrophobic/amphiphilic exporter-1